MRQFAWVKFATRSMATMDLSDVSIETDQIREWRSIITLIVFLLASKHTRTPTCVCPYMYAGSRYYSIANSEAQTLPSCFLSISQSIYPPDSGTPFRIHLVLYV